MKKNIKKIKKFRSSNWFGRKDIMGFVNRSWMKNQGFAAENFDGRPVIGICNTASEVTPCNAHLGKISEAVKRGVWKAGGFPLEFPVTSLGETLMKPTTMLFRNLVSMDVEESIRANPFDGIILLTGCDKTTPACIMGAASVDLPTILISGGPMLNGKYKGKEIGSGTDLWKLVEDLQIGKITEKDFEDAEAAMSRSSGHCMVMGTASTMATISEALGLQMPGMSSYPAVDSRRYALSELAGIQIVKNVYSDLKLSKILTRKAFENAIKINAAIGGSTNAIIHLLAIAKRVNVKLELKDFDGLIKNIPFILNLKPSGEFLMEDYCYAGGLPVVMNEIIKHLNVNVKTITNKSLLQNIKNVKNFNNQVIRTIKNPINIGAGTAVLTGNLAPNGAVIKISAASKRLLKHTGKAVVFENVEDLHKRINNPKTNIDKNSIMVLKNAGPIGYPGMPEVGNLPIPASLLKKGINDIVRISDGRMSGTSFGTVILHVSPESALGGPLALVKSGDIIELDVKLRKLELLVDKEELNKRKLAWKPPSISYKRGWTKLYVDTVEQAHKGCDLDFLTGNSGEKVERSNH